MPVDYSAIPTQDLLALKSGNYRAVSTKTLQMLKDNMPPQSEYVGDTSGRSVKDMEKEFIQREGTLGTRLRNTSLKDAAYNAAMEVPRLAQEMVTVPVNSAIKAGYGLAAIPVAATQGVEAATKMIQGRPQLQGPMEPSMVGTAIGSGVETINEALPQNVAGDIGRGALEAGMDIAGLVGGGKVLANAGKGAMMTAKQVAADPAQAFSKTMTNYTLKQPKTLERSIRDRNTQTALDNDLLGSGVPKAVDKLDAAIATTEGKLGEITQQGSQAGLTTNFDRTIAALEALKNRAKNTDDPAGNIALIDAEIAKVKGGTWANDIDAVRGAKIEQGRQIQKKYQTREGQVSTFMDDINKARVRGFKEDIEATFDNAFPELAGQVKSTNKQLSDYYALKKELGNAASRIQDRNVLGWGPPISTTSGGLIGTTLGGPVGGAIGTGLGFTIGLLEHPATAPRIAQALYNASKGKLTRTGALAEAKARLANIAQGLKMETPAFGTQSEVQQ